MPQIHDVADFLQYLKREEIHHTKGQIVPRHLMPTQGEVNLNLVFKLIETGLNTQGHPILISGDNHILDGHHRWYAADVLADLVHYVRVSVDIHRLLKLTQHYTGTVKVGIGDIQL